MSVWTSLSLVFASISTAISAAMYARTRRPVFVGSAVFTLMFFVTVALSGACSD